MSSLRMNPGDLESLEQLAMEGYGSLEDYYPGTFYGEGDFDPEHGGEGDPREFYYGRNVIWLGDDGKMIRVDPNYAHQMPLNIFEADKLAAVVSGIEDAPDRLVFEAPYGTVTLVDPITVKESIEYGEEEPQYILTTGDDELDEWLVDPETFIDDRIDPDDFRTKAQYEAAKNELMTDMATALEDAVHRNEGDLGEFIYTFRDGNHRAFGAFIAGEPYVYLKIAPSQMQDVFDPDDQRPTTIALREALE